MNMFLGTLLTFFFVAATWFTDTWYTGHPPTNSNHVFDNTGKSYKVAKVVNDKTLFDEVSYKAYFPVYLSGISFYGTYFATHTSAITHAPLYNRREIVAGFKNLICRRSAFANFKDVHTRRGVLEWAYFVVLYISIGLGAIGIVIYIAHSPLHPGPQTHPLHPHSTLGRLQLQDCFLIGALLPVPSYFLSRKRKVLQHFHAPVFFHSGTVWAPYNLGNVWPAVPVAWLFNYNIKKLYLDWWSKYNYVTASAFSCAIALSALVVFFALQQQGIEIDWSENLKAVTDMGVLSTPSQEVTLAQALESSETFLVHRENYMYFPRLSYLNGKGAE